MTIWEKRAATRTQTKSFYTSHFSDSQNGKKPCRVTGRQKQKMPRCHSRPWEGPSPSHGNYTLKQHWGTSSHQQDWQNLKITTHVVGNSWEGGALYSWWNANRCNCGIMLPWWGQRSTLGLVPQEPSLRLFVILWDSSYYVAPDGLVYSVSTSMTSDSSPKHWD